MEYTARLERARINRMLKFRSKIGCGRGMGAHIRRARVRASIGANKNNTGEEVEGRTGSLRNSFTPSAMGCSSP